MKLLALFLASILLAGCAQSSDSGLLINASCAQTSHTQNYPFTAPAGMADASVYSCAVHDKMSCKYAQSDDRQTTEMLCTGDTSNPQGVPAGCTLDPIAGGVHYFWTTGETLTADRYNCGTLGPMRCDYYAHAPDALSGNLPREEVLCFDADRAQYLKAQLPYP